MHIGEGVHIPNHHYNVMMFNTSITCINIVIVFNCPWCS